MGFPPGPNFIVPTPAVGDSSNRAASTEFVTLAIASASVAVPAVATQAQMQVGASTTVFVAPAVQQFHPSAAKCWLQFDGTGPTIKASYNVSGIITSGAGDYTVTFLVPFSLTSYVVSGVCNTPSVAVGFPPLPFTRSTTTLRFLTPNAAAVPANFTEVSLILFGTQ